MPSPSLKYLDFYDISKNSEHINTHKHTATSSKTDLLPHTYSHEYKQTHSQNIHTQGAVHFSLHSENTSCIIARIVLTGTVNC